MSGGSEDTFPGPRQSSLAPVEPPATALEWAHRHRQTFEALVRVGYIRSEALAIMAAENWAKLYEPDDDHP